MMWNRLSFRWSRLRAASAGTRSEAVEKTAVTKGSGNRAMPLLLQIQTISSELGHKPKTWHENALQTDKPLLFS